VVAAAAAILSEPGILLQHSIPLRAVTSVEDASWRPDNGSRQSGCVRRTRFGSNGLVLLIAPYREVIRAQLERATVASKTVARTRRATMSSRGTRPIGTVIGIAITTIGGMGTVAISPMVSGSSMTSDSIHTIPGIRTITTRTVTTIPIITIPVSTKATTPIIITAKAPKSLRRNTPMPLLPALRNS